MPREQINYTEPNTRNREDEEATLHVNWTAGDAGYVQVSLNLTAERIKEWADQLDDSVSHTAFYTPALNRTEINKLIRVLRTARDRAHGRDE